MTDEERAALGESFARIIDGGLGDHLKAVEQELFVKLLKARTQRTSRNVRAEIKAVQHVVDFILTTIGIGEIERQNLLVGRQIEEGERKPWH